MGNHRSRHDQTLSDAPARVAGAKSLTTRPRITRSTDVKSLEHMGQAMRINLLILTCILLMTIPAAAQFYEPDTPFDLGSPPLNGVTVPIGSDAGLASLEQAVVMGDRRASALLAVLLQDSPDVENSLVRSAIYFRWPL